MNPQILGKTIQTCRKERHLSQEVLSGLAGIDRSHLSKIELGVRSPTVSVLYKLASAMELTGSQLLAAAEQMEDKRKPPR
mgnify:CR=1 FL=1